MTSQQIRDLHAAKPFKPFEIHIADGDVLKVPHPELMWIHPSGRTIYVARGPRDEDGTAIVDLLLVTKLIKDSGNAKGQNGRGKDK